MKNFRRLLAKIICPSVFRELANEGHKVWWMSCQLGEVISWMPRQSESSLTAQWLNQRYCAYFSQDDNLPGLTLPAQIHDFRTFLENHKATQKDIIHLTKAKRIKAESGDD